ncbi:MAG: hypothetical protein IKW77_01640 [Salinivirgaceae bacterium]|nr:hypothetical protein [Salinivirgaceae bacterium]
MNKDKALEELFLAQKPQFNDSEEFMASLEKRLEAVEFIKRHQEATIRRYKMAMVAAFVVGIVSGGVTIAFLLSAPAAIPLFSFQTQTVLLSWLAENARSIVAAALALLMAFGLISIFNNIQDIRSMREKRNAVFVSEKW